MTAAKRAPARLRENGPAKIRVNGEDRALPAGGLSDLLRELEIDPAARGLAMALNGAVVRRADWARVILKDGDSLEIVKLFAGG